MSLDKWYAIGCEGNLLMIRRAMASETRETIGSAVEAGKADRAKVRDKCAGATEIKVSARAARAAARLLGYVRYAEDFPLYSGSSDTSTIRFDLCPNCAGELVADGKGTRYAVPGITTNEGSEA